MRAWQLCAGDTGGLPRDDEGRVLGTYEHGEIHVRGEQVSGEYEGIGRLTDEQGWFPTRDGGFLDDEGYLFLEGRAGDVIVRGGENMSPGEIEDVMMTHDAVSDVAIVGVVVLKHSATAESLQQWVKDRMRSSRVPERLEFWDELPYNETGKLLRREVRARLTESTSGNP